MRTLHAYLARELLKTFLMTTVALTLLLVMGGGVANIFRSQAIGAEEMAKVFAFLTPVAVTLILPVAALFSAAITYGRAAADNEVSACRAAGINIHKLLLSAALLGLFVTVFTYWSWNFMIPHLSGRIEELSRRDLPSIVKRQFEKAKPLSFGKYRLTANRCQTIPDDKLPEQTRDTHTYLQLAGVSFVEIEDQEPVRYGSADETIIAFDNSTNIPRITVDLQGVRSFDASRRQYYELKHQILGPFDIPIPIRHKTKFENLERLLHYTKHPEDIPEIQDRLFGLKRELMTCFLAQDLEDHLTGGQEYELQGPQVSYRISALQYRTDEYDGRPSLQDVTVVETRGSEKRMITAEMALLKLKSSLDRDNPVIVLDLVGDVQTRRVPARSGDRIIKRPRETLQSVHFMDQQRLAEKVAAFDFPALLDHAHPVAMPKRQTRMRHKLLQRLSEFKAEVRGEIHFRASYSLCAIAIVLFGAVLGIIVRGGQVLTAFGISCIPMILVVVASIVGRNLADRPEFAALSTGVMWGVAIFMYLATAVFAARVLKR
jgi:lipopolysaccharide export LptBFGC system permease protein LptF